MRQKGGRLSWDGWEPRAGMVGYVMHIWRPNHPNKVYRTPLNRDVYLIEIGKNYVPVTANGLRHYNQAMDSNQIDMETSRRSSLQKEMTELRQQQQAERGLTPILGSSLESPTSLLAEAAGHTSSATATDNNQKPKIQAVSSSSSEDESCLLSLQQERHEAYLKNLWQQVIEHDQHVKQEIENTTTNTNIPYTAKETNTEQQQLIRDNKTQTDKDTETELQTEIEIETDENQMEKMKSNNDKNKTKQSLNKTNNKQTDNETTTTASKDLANNCSLPSLDSGNVCAKELIEQLVDHVVDNLCDTVELEENTVETKQSVERDEQTTPNELLNIEVELQANKSPEDIQLIETKFSDNSTDV